MLVEGKPDTVNWQLDNSLRHVAMTPAEALPDSLGRYSRYRLWLIPNNSHLQDNPLETGFLPRVSFSNVVVKNRDTTNLYPILLGNGSDFITTDSGTTVDSAPPVIADFLLQNNACNPDNEENSIRISFSEPVKYENFPGYKNVRAFTLINTPEQDSGFMSQVAIRGGRHNIVYDKRLAWNYGNEPTRMMTYEVSIRDEAEHMFRPNVARIRFAVDPDNFQIVDLWGNPACSLANRMVTLKNDLSALHYICDVVGNTEVNRWEAIGFGYSVEDGILKPNFPYFGFTINFDLITSSTAMNTITLSFSIGSEDYVIVDFDPDYNLVSTYVNIFDVLGNNVANSSDNSTLRMDYTITEVKQAMGYEDIEDRIERNELNMTEILDHYVLFESENQTFPDTLKPRYPATLSFDYDYLMQTCGPNSSRDMCVPAWNCLNSKGRLVAPGGYFAIQAIITPGEMEEVKRKFIVTGSAEERNFSF
jgi:hypothetical protein